MRRIQWEEFKLQKCNDLPPLYVLENIDKAKDKFDIISIVKIQDETVKFFDPLVVGRNHGDKNRYFIDYWDNDIDVSQINML